MQVKEINKFVEDFDNKFRTVEDETVPKSEMAYARLAKVGEEFGELADQILGHFSQPQRKKERHTDQEMGYEMADVVLSLFRLANHLNVDMDKVLSEKMEKIRNKYDF